MNKYKLLITYDGTQYSGWQIQPNAVSIQETIEQVLATFLQSPIRIVAAGRTDAGVHALGQVAHFSLPNEINPSSFLKSANALLPADIRIRTIEAVPDDFHAQYSAKGKIYQYNLWLDPVRPPFERHYSYHVRHEVDLDLLRKACSLFVGKRDFTSFANSPQHGSVARNPVRTLYRLDVVPQKGGVRLEFEGDGFLYKMVRNIVGTLLDVTRGKRDVEEIPQIFAAKKRPKAGKTAYPNGLFLVKVHY